MFEKIFNVVFYKTSRKNGITVISAKREIKDFAATEKTDVKSVKGSSFWDNRGKIYGSLFTSLNGRTF